MTLLRALATAATVSCLLTPALAAATAPASLPWDERQLRGYVAEQVAAAGPAASRLEVEFGQLHPGLRLAACGEVQPFVPSGRKLWGRSSLGLRCVQGASWSVLLPMTVRAWGPAMVAAAPLEAGAVLSLQDFEEQEIELTREPPTLVRDPSQWEGRTLVRALHPGQALRTDMVRHTAVVKSGDPVRLQIVGSGFQIQAAGQALGQAAEGQSLRVRTELGKVVTGVARAGRVVEVRP